jgi:hypothetical protein
MSKASILALGLAAGAIVGGGIGLELLHLPPAVVTGIGAGVSAAIVTWGLRRWVR